MRRSIELLLLLVFALILLSCNDTRRKSDKDAYETVSGNENADAQIYRYYCGEKDGFKIWIVDGARIRKEISNEFIYGGNPERYTFIPGNEIWIDNSVSSEEFETTLAHELNERALMAKFAMAYYDAHDSSLALELRMRREFLKKSAEYEERLPKLAPIDFDSTQEIADIPELVKLKNIYRIPEGERQGIKVWIVDGFTVRRDIYPDFGFSGNDLAYHFIPVKEIWIDGSVSCEETEYSVRLELRERELMSEGKDYDDAYSEALKVSDSLRTDMQKLRNSLKPLKINYPLYRDTGSGKEKAN